MPKWQRFYVIACTFVIAYAVTYVLVNYARLPRLYYYPIERVYRFESTPGALAMGYVGLWVWAMIAGTVCAAIAAATVRMIRREVGSRALGLGAAWSLSSVALAGAYYTWQNWP